MRHRGWRHYHERDLRDQAYLASVARPMTPDPNGAHNIDVQDYEPPRRFQLIIVLVTLALIGAFFVFAA
jgi:hypothetical protein